MPSIDRRELIQNAALLAGATVTAAATLHPEPADAQALPAGRSPMIYEVKKLPFEPSRIKGMSEKLLVSHYENNYTGAVKRLNAIAAHISDFSLSAIQHYKETTSHE